MRISPLNIGRLAIHVGVTFLLVYLAYVPEIVMSEGLHDKAELFAKAAGAEFTTRMRSISEAKEIGGLLGMIDTLTGHENGLEGLVTSTVRALIDSKLPPRMALSSDKVLRWASFGALIVALASTLSVLLWTKIGSRNIRGWLGAALAIPLVVVVLWVTEAAASVGGSTFDTWNVAIYGASVAIIMSVALIGRPLPNLLAGALGLLIYAGVGITLSGQLPGAHNQTLAAAASLSDIRGNLIDPKMAELGKIPIAGPLMVDFVNQFWQSPEHKQEIEQLKQHTDVAAQNLRALGITEIAAGWLEVLFICIMLNLALGAISRDMSLLRSAQAAAAAALTGPDTP
ncbi:MAG: hypothetical protein FJ146_16350 [Deltaproteobacteria bacterium]|nr:hypothetical protein [Deltaproteobacteria bacterium]